MIQRRQTIFMFLSAIISTLLFFIPLASFTDGTSFIRFSICGIENNVEGLTLSQSNTWPLIILTVLMIIVPIYTALRYKKRELQVKLCKIAMLINIVFIGVVLLYFEADIQAVIDTIEGNDMMMNSRYFGIAIPVVNLILQIFAIRGVKKDIELLKSIDRLR